MHRFAPEVTFLRLSQRRRVQVTCGPQATYSKTENLVSESQS